MSERRVGESYPLNSDEVQKFKQEGYLLLKKVILEKELDELENWFDHFISGKEMDRMGKDFCDMSQPYGTPLEDFRLINAMLPSTYRPELIDNIFHRITKNIANQLHVDGDADLDYEQFLAKKPERERADFAMHQDQGYWPKTDNTWTATFSLALTDADEVNGCLFVIPGSHREEELRKHFYKDSDRDESHTLVIEERESDKKCLLPVKRGDITIHNERIVHGSGGNLSKTWRKTYIAAYRDKKTIAAERKMGFTHSHNDKVDWDSIL